MTVLVHAPEEYFPEGHRFYLPVVDSRYWPRDRIATRNPQFIKVDAMEHKGLFGRLTILVVTMGLACTFSRSQAKPQTAQTPSTASTAGAQPLPVILRPIPVASLASEVEAANSRLTRIRLDLEQAAKVSAAEQQLAVVATSLQRIRPMLDSRDRLREEELFNIRQELTRFNLRLEQLQGELGPKARLLEERREELLKMERLWKVTYQSLSSQEAPGSSRDLVIVTQRRIDETLNLVRTCRPVLLTTQNRISEQRITLDVLLDRTNETIGNLRKGLFSLDSEPLWRVARSMPVSASLVQTFRSSYLGRALPLYDYLKDQRRRLFVHLVIFFLLIWLVAVVSQGSRKWVHATGAGPESANVLRHPLAAALVISLLLSFSIYPNGPMTLYRLPFLLIMFPLARVVSGVLSREERTSFYLLSGLYFLLRLDGLFFSADLLFRLFVLILSFLGILVALRSARVDRLALQNQPGSWRGIRLHLARIAGAILFGAMIANVAGNVTLATLLVSACINSAYAGVALFAGVLVLEGFVLPLFLSPLAEKSAALREKRDEFRRHSSFLIRAAALIAWAWSTLLVFGISGPVLGWLYTLLTEKHSFGQITFSMGGILLFGVTICVSVWTARFAAFIAEKDILSRMKLPQGIPATVSMLVRDIVIAFGFILALAGAGVQWGQIVLIASAIGVGIGLGLQQLVASFIAGLILIFERPIRVGDTIVLGKIEGVVTRIGLRSSTVRGVDGSEIVCPNSRLISDELINWTLSDEVRRIELQVSVGREADPDVVLSALKKVAAEHPGILPNPKSTAFFRGFGESSLDFALRFFTHNNGWVLTSSDVGVQIHGALLKEGVEIALPKRDIRITAVGSVSEKPEAVFHKSTST